MNGFQFSLKQNIIFSPGAIKKVPELLKENNVSKVLIVSDRMLEKVGLIHKLTILLEEASLEWKCFLDVEPNPSTEIVEAAAEYYKACGADALVAIGGGSSMDVAKATAVLATCGGKIVDYEGSGKISGEMIPLIAIPTTAGTGSEATRTAVITDQSRNYKFCIVGDEILPRYAILDPELITTLPAGVAASTGIDALVHAIEAYISLASNPFTDAMAEKAMELIGQNIRRFTANRRDVEAAGAMLLGSCYAGVAFTRAMLGNVHAMAHPLGGHFNIAHGVANAVLLPVVIEYNALADNGKYERIYRIIRIDKDEDKNFRAEMLAHELRKLIADLGIPQRLRELGVTEDKIPAMAEDAMKSGNVPINPRQTTQKDFETLYRKAF